MADVNIAERRIPQDGRISLVVQGKQIDIRLATLPTVHGEKIVMRILDKSSVLLKLSDLGFLPENYERFEKSFVKPYGEILVTGPTGSGKSTTLYATLNILNKPDRNIITVEDPVEYRLPGVNQVQVHPRAGLTFASALRSILRADPDIILIGEIRDSETARISTEAALTGHLVLSTLHTNDAPQRTEPTRRDGHRALPRVLGARLRTGSATRPKALREMQGAVPTDRRRAAFARRSPSVAKRCRSCSRRWAAQPVQAPDTRAGWRCTRSCRSPRSSRGSRSRASSSEVLKKVAIEQGMITLREDGMEKVRMGATSIQEILRVVV